MLRIYNLIYLSPLSLLFWSSCSHYFIYSFLGNRFSIRWYLIYLCVLVLCILSKDIDSIQTHGRAVLTEIGVPRIYRCGMESCSLNLVANILPSVLLWHRTTEYSIKEQCFITYLTYKKQVLNPFVRKYLQFFAWWLIRKNPFIMFERFFWHFVQCALFWFVISARYLLEYFTSQALQGNPRVQVARSYRKRSRISLGNDYYIKVFKIVSV